ncbi:MAG TPA: hypothetical protein VFN55_05220 [Solirubrobacteraceae bacterium]|nr:hypothetical protein [Solirubrobacteraceae bacterium]
MRRGILAAAAVCVLALAGCGGSSEPSLSAFKTGFVSEKTAFRKLGLDLQQEITGAKSKTDAQLATEINALAVRASNQADGLAKLNPPAKFKAQLSKLVAGFRSVSTDLRSIATAAVKHDAASARTATMTLLTDAAKVKSADDAITQGLGLKAS